MASRLDRSIEVSSPFYRSLQSSSLNKRFSPDPFAPPRPGSVRGRCRRLLPQAPIAAPRAERQATLRLLPVGFFPGLGNSPWAGSGLLTPVYQDTSSRWSPA